MDSSAWNLNHFSRASIQFKRCRGVGGWPGAWREYTLLFGFAALLKNNQLMIISGGGLVFSGLERLLVALLVARVVGAMVVVVGQARFRSAEGLIPGWKQFPLYVSRRVYNDGLPHHPWAAAIPVAFIYITNPAYFGAHTVELAEGSGEGGESCR